MSSLRRRWPGRSTDPAHRSSVVTGPSASAAPRPEPAKPTNGRLTGTRGWIFRRSRLSARIPAGDSCGPSTISTRLDPGSSVRHHDRDPMGCLEVQRFALRRARSILSPRIEVIGVLGISSTRNIGPAFERVVPPRRPQRTRICGVVGRNGCAVSESELLGLGDDPRRNGHVGGQAPANLVDDVPLTRTPRGRCRVSQRHDPPV